MAGNPMKSKQATISKARRQRRARRTKPDSHTPSLSTNLHDRIASRAFENYERRIRQGPLDDWLQAEKNILGPKWMTKKQLIRDFKILRAFCIEWRKNYNTYRFLFSFDPDIVSILNKVAPAFFLDIQNMMSRDLYSRCSVLMDPPKSMGFENLSIEYINFQLENIGLLNGQAKRLTKSLLAYGIIIRHADNKLIGHLDLKSARRNRSLGKHKTEKLDAFLRNIQKYCDSVGEQLDIGPLDFSASPCKGDVQDLLRALRDVVALGRTDLT
jgi:hypothetical protein